MLRTSGSGGEADFSSPPDAPALLAGPHLGFLRQIGVGVVALRILSFRQQREYQDKLGLASRSAAYVERANGLIYAVVIGAALLTAWLPARRASNVYPAEALRYE